MNPHPFIILITGLLILLWAYASFSKLFDLKQFNHALMIQVFPRWLGKILLFALPISEIALIVLLLIPETRLIGMYSSMFLMALFTLYVGGAVFHIYDRHPCACGGLFGRLGWHKHFKVNIMLTLIALAGVILMEI
ncbi:Methylamine utilisation protein MauE [Pedobacter westerhofensis]|uniref:Methylamine utilisation protein MauE n=1 Tax=Pedobacter westerhofensis TaxID=425512 RepID=A0A521FRY2_9SPHI|nr:MauE/DoxX family redox-associated membrane protein [Pedobacter westerhofensis]SMO98889.1 Methylamine utilisation protein MauE [Pedobacter westerhofensis]